MATKNFITLFLTGWLGTSLTSAAPATITVEAHQPQHVVAPTMWGLFFEDINYAADGGLYAELVQNRSFEHRDKLFAWHEVKRGGWGGHRIASDLGVHPNNPNYLRLEITTAGYGVMNTGFGGIAVRDGGKYWFAAHVRSQSGYAGELIVRLEDEAGLTLGETRIKSIGAEWRRHELTLRSKATTAKARLVILATAAGTVDLDVVSLFPQDTFKGRRNGLRKDLAQLLADIKPGSFRFPGGCIVEGTDFNNMYRWKDTVGEIWERKQNWNLWQNDESPQYHQTYGLGFFEYFQFCADIGAEPVPILNCGMCCQARRGRHVPLDQLQPFIQDALDLIEFANGPVTSPWGALRARMGQPQPFNLKFIGIGNEQWNQEYFDRYEPFYRAIKAQHPEIKIISTSGPGPSDDLYHFAWGKFRSGTPADLVDEHYYRPPQWFLDNINRYDSYDRNGPKVFAGEYAAHDNNRKNNLRSAIAEGAFMTGLLKNADVVQMTAYAPLFAKVGHVQWRPDLIWFDNTRSYGSPSYYVQQLYGQHRPDRTLPTVVQAPLREPAALRGRIGVGTWRTQAEFKDIKVTRGDATLFASDFTRDLAGWQTYGGSWRVEDGALRQTSEDENVRAFIGDPSWSDYTVTLKARKLSGAEGFLISFANQDPETVTWWNIAGWNNTQHGLEVSGATVPQVRGRVETNVWYDIRIELRGANVKCYLNNKLVQEAVCRPVQALHAMAGRDDRTGETIVTVANYGEAAQTATVKLNGVGKVMGRARISVVQANSPEAENSFAEPQAVAPITSTISIPGPEFSHQFPPWSLTVLRLQAK